MDSVTQIALGAAVGEVTIGHKVGWRAPLWGGLCGLLPDLDVLWQFSDPIATFTWHRGYTHSLAILTLATPIITRVIIRTHPKTRPFWRSWLLLVFLALITHPLLDCLTVYGTQIFLPFSNFPVNWSTIFIIDPVFSTPLILGVLAALLVHKKSWGHKLNTVGLTAALMWLAITAAIKVHVNRVVETSLPTNVTRYLTTPSPFNTVLWRMVAMTKDGYYLEGYYSLLDKKKSVSFIRRPDGHKLLTPLRKEPSVTRLIWFSHGFFSGQELTNGEIVISDLRMGLEGRFVFSFVVGQRKGDTIEAVPVHQHPTPNFPPGSMKALWRRVLNQSPNPACISCSF